MAEEKEAAGQSVCPDGPLDEKQKGPEMAVQSAELDGESGESRGRLSPGSRSTSSHDSEHEAGAKRRSSSAAGRLAPITAVTSRHSAVVALDDLASVQLSAPGGAPMQTSTSYVEVPDSFYDRLPVRRKRAIVALLSFCSFLAPISSTAVLPAIPDITAEFATTATVVNISNALYMLFMGMSPLLWGPLSEVYGRRAITLSTLALFLGCSIGTALAPNLAAYFVFRILTAFEGTAFILVGSAAISDIYRPTERATAVGWFLMGTLFGPAFGPFLGGIIVTYRSWRVIFWLQTALTGVALAGALVLLPETIFHRKSEDLAGYAAGARLRVLGSMINPMRVIRLYVYPNVCIAGAGSSSLVWNQYSLLTPISYVLNPRFHLTSPMQSGLFYLAPGCGYVVGTFVGGRYADYVVRQWIVRRGGVRVPEDRLRSALPFLGLVIPACMLIYGWAVERDVGGIPLVVVVMFLQGVAQLFCFPSLNTYCLDVMQENGSDVIAGNYFIRYIFACFGTAVVLPAVEGIGIGWFSTISALFLAASAAGLYAAVLWGKEWRERIGARLRRERMAKAERARAQLGGAAEA